MSKGANSMTTENTRQHCQDCFGTLLNWERSSKRISLQVLGDRVGFSRTRMWDFEHGILPSSVGDVTRIAAGLDLNEGRCARLIKTYRCDLLAKADFSEICQQCPCINAAALPKNNNRAA